MAKNEEKMSHQVRVAADLGDMIAWVARIEGVTTSQLLDPLLRSSITARYKKHEELIEEMRAAEQALRAAEEKARQKAKESAQNEVAQTKKKKSD